MCQRPNIIINPRLPLFTPDRIKESVLFGVVQHVPVNNSLDLISYLNVEKSRWVDRDDEKYSEFSLFAYQSSYLVLTDGTKVPIYVLCPCCKCIECREQYKKDICSRAIIEGSNSRYVVFYTLTYSDYFCPDSLRKSDVVGAFKRLRQHIHRYISKDIEFTNFYVGEYGTNLKFTRRPHYHGILFFHGNITYDQLEQIREIFKPLQYQDRHKKWHFNKFYVGRRDTRRIQIPFWPYGKMFGFELPKKGCQALAEYVTKYVTKQLKEKDLEHQLSDESLECHREPPFVQMPKSIGLGVRYLDKYKDFILKGNSTIEVLDSATHKCKRVAVPLIFLNKLYTPFSQIVPNAAFYAQLFIRLSVVISQRLGGRFLESGDFPNLLHNQDYVLNTINSAKYKFRLYRRLRLQRRQLIQLENAVYYAEQKMSNADIFSWLALLYEKHICKLPDSDVFYKYVIGRYKFMQSLNRTTLEWSQLYKLHAHRAKRELYKMELMCNSPFDLIR